MFITQVRLRRYIDGAWVHVWCDIAPVGGTAYVYATEREAECALHLSNDGARTREEFRVLELPIGGVA